MIPVALHIPYKSFVYYLFGTTEQEELWYVTVMWQYWNIL